MILTSELSVYKQLLLPLLRDARKFELNKNIKVKNANYHTKQTLKEKYKKQPAWKIELSTLVLTT